MGDNANFKPRNILLFGATGTIGSYLAAALLAAKSDFGRIGIFTSSASLQRNAAAFDDFIAKGAEIHTGDLQNESDVKRAYSGKSTLLSQRSVLSDVDLGYDTVISPVGRDAIPMQINLIKWAEEGESIKRYFPSEFGTDVEYSRWSTQQRIHQEKLKVRSFIREKTQALEHTYLMTGPYGDGYIVPIPPIPQIGSYDAKAHTAWLLEPVEQKICFTTRTDVGRFLVAALLNPDISRNKALKVSSFIASHADILRQFEKLQSGEKWEAHYTSPEQLAEITQEASENHSWWWATCALRACWTKGESVYDQYDNEALGITETQTLEDVARAKIAAATTN